MFSSASAASAPSDRSTSRSSSVNGRPRRATVITPWARSRRLGSTQRDRGDDSRRRPAAPPNPHSQRGAFRLLRQRPRFRPAILPEAVSADGSSVGRSGAETVPPLAWTASTAVFSASSSSAGRSRLEANVWPIRRIASRSRARSRDSSSSRRDSSVDMLLNSSARAANSSRPSTLIGEEKSPLPSRRAASRNPRSRA